MNSKEPMTFDDWFDSEKFDFEVGTERYYKMNLAWQACEAQQAKVIAELREQLSNIVVTDNTPVIAQQAQTIADLVEALEECLREHGGFTIKGQCERRAREALAKVKVK